MLISLVLYGSRARGDHRMRSDVDLLGVIEGGAIQKGGAKRGTNLHLYPFHYLKHQSLKGNLFLLHLTHEGIVLHDPLDTFEQVQEAFRFKRSYAKEVREASAVIWYALQPRFDQSMLIVRRRLVWAIRTILIARSAEERQVNFSSKSLEAFSGFSGLKHVIDNRNVEDIDLLVFASKTIARRHGYSARRIDLSRQYIEDEAITKFGRIAASTAASLGGGKSQYLAFHYE